jgi:transposase-like protein
VPSLKLRVALEAMLSVETLAELTQKHDVNATQLAAWKCDLQHRAAAVFDNGKTKCERKLNLDRLHAKIGQPTW